MAEAAAISVPSRRERALELLIRFADRTGLTAGSGNEPDRYLWTDAFAVRAFLALGENELAARLVNRVHHILGQHRPDSGREGWLDGANEEHPTRGGLRIGKKLPERAPREPFDEQLEWDRDGQYFHYLTKWMEALRDVGRTEWAIELMQAAHRGFVYRVPGSRHLRMFWKMSIDLTRPLVPSMGHHDPLDGYLSCVDLAPLRLADQAADFASMIPADLATADPLGIGGLLSDAARCDRAIREGKLAGRDLLDRILDAAVAGLEQLTRRGELRMPATHRLAFRELGLAIGLGQARDLRGGCAAGDTVERLERFAPLADRIEAFWLEPAHRSTRTYLGHANINDVMLATSLVTPRP